MLPLSVIILVLSLNFAALPNTAVITPTMGSPRGPTPTNIPEIVETFRLPTVLATLPIHIFNVLFVLVVLASILSTRHLHSRPQKLFAINCGFFLIASLYDLAFDISYLAILDRPITVQTCSVIRNFVYNPIATQAFVDALERFSMAFFHHDMSVLTVFTLYSAFPLICIGLAVYNSFISLTLIQTDDVCETVRRTEWTNVVLIAIQWGSAVIAVLLYIAVWRKVKRERVAKFSPNDKRSTFDPIKMCSNRYYWDRHVVKIFFISCVLPLFLAAPSLVFTVLTEFHIYQDSVANIVSIVILDLATPITWIIYISYIGHIRRGLYECLCCFSSNRRSDEAPNQKAGSDLL
ncbi:hypothetical protein Y032_0059g2954 [Ancylostoma ceylanicum]|uniref:G-protein coupled receptors family 1 profile domain-containing protein n=1 Tax=Ancylostoma ceylanicum TaxID=53326 RepID=A0A016U451_9BILA|nr:hypothetical protein Y032_0059g2954 [Ancylostoma ceylanicum]